MKRFGWLLAAWVLLFSLLSANADADGVCAAPVNYRTLAAGEAPGGIGGTGHGADPGDGGIGGTGRSGDDGQSGGIGGTGIVGTITGFASICVNGLEVHYDNAVPVSENGRPGDVGGLAIGQVVAVEAGRSARGLEARRIAVLHALEGPVTRPLDAQGTLEVMGARVTPGNAALREQARALRSGDWVQVNGHPDAEAAVLASRVARISPRQEVSVSGRGDPERRQVGGVPVDRTTTGELTVRGRWDGRRLDVRDSRPAAGTEWNDRPSRVVIETRVRQRDGHNVRTGRADVDALLGRRGDELTAGMLIRVTAQRDADGRLHPVRIERAGNERQETRSGAHVDEAERTAREAAKDAERQEKAAEREARDAREARERSERAAKDRADRIERADRNDRNERSERSGRDH